MAPRRRRTKADEHALRIRHLIAVDATNVLRRLTARKDEMVSLFSRLRNREPFLETLRSLFSTVEFQSLSALSTREQAIVNAFYESLADLRWYLQYTEDMPLMVRTTVTQHLSRLDIAYAQLVEVLGRPNAEGAIVVNAEGVVRIEETAKALPGSTVAAAKHRKP